MTARAASALALSLLVAAACAPRATAAADSSSAESPVAPKAGKRVLVIRAAELHVGDGQVHAPGEILIENGRIKSLGAKVESPADAETWDEPTGIITPWLVDPSVRVPLAPGEAGKLESALLSSADARPAFDPHLELLAEQGLVAVALVPEGGSDILGRTAVIGMVGPPGAARVLVRDAQLAVALGAARTSAPSSTAAAAARLELADLLDATERYSKKRAEWTSKHESGAARRDATGHRRSGRPSTKEPRAEPARDVLARVNEKKLPLRVMADRAADVRALLALAKKRGLSLTLVGCRECAVIADLVAESGASVVLEPARESAADEAGLSLDPQLAARLAGAGARLAVSAGGAWPSGPAWLRVLAADLAGRGVPREAAIAAMTGEAARAAGLPDPMLAPGSSARVLVWDRDPLEPAARVVRRLSPDDASATKATDPAPSAVAASAPRAVAASARSAAAPSPTERVAIRARMFDGARWQDDALVVMSGGRVESVATKAAEPPADAFLLDVAGAMLTPGFIDCDSALGISNRRDEPAEPASLDLRLGDAFAPDEGESEALRRSGVTLAWLASGPASILGARSALVQPTVSGAARVLNADAGPCASLRDEASAPDRAPSSVAAQAALISSLVDPSGTGVGGAGGHAGLRVRFDDAGSVRLAKELAADGGLIVGLPATEHALTEVLAGDDAALLCLSGLGPAASFEQLRLAAQAATATPFVLGTGGARAGPASLRWAAAALVARGVPEDRILSALTREAAIAAAAGRRGVIEPGAIADLVLWSASPLSPASRVLVSWVSGEQVHSHD